jgi:predicted nucleotidyltransferase component of viral defense system
MKILLEQAENFAKGNEFLKWTILKEILHYDILEALYKSNIAKELVFQGGTSLRLCYNAVRYSEDLDFVLKDGKSFSSELMGEFENVFVRSIKTKYGLQAAVRKKEKNNELDRVVVDKWIAKVVINDKNSAQQRINIEIAAAPSHDNEFRVITNNYDINNANFGFYVETLEEILADKIVAVSQRAYFKARDFWDIHYLTLQRGVKLNRELVNKKIADYSIAEFEKNFFIKSTALNEDKNKELFKTEMKRFLSQDLYDMLDDNFVEQISKSVVKFQDEIKKNSVTDDNKPLIRKHR